MSFGIDHPAFKPFHFQKPQIEPGYRIDRIGAYTREHYMPADWFDTSEVPALSEGLFEWIDLLDAVATSDRTVRVIDLGAGYGRWLVIAALAAKQLGKKCHLVGVEAEPVHFAWMIEHFRDNKIGAGTFLAIQAPVAAEEQEVLFVEGHASEWYGQSILPDVNTGYGSWAEAKIRKQRAISALSVIDRFSKIDALHMDLQGEELHIVPSIMDVASKNTRRMHVETHTDEIDRTLPGVFERHGWIPRFQFPQSTLDVETPLGKINFQGGIQSWENPRFRPRRLFPVLAFIRRMVRRRNGPVEVSTL